MGRYTYSQRYTDNDSLCVSIPELTKQGYLRHGIQAEFGWSNGFGELGRIQTTAILTERPRVILKYDDQQYPVELVKVPCNLGGFRWAFECPIFENYKHCGKKVYTLYKPPNSPYFGCRNCMQIVYKSQRDGRLKSYGLFRALDIENEICNLWHEIQRKSHYRGKPTRKVLRYEKLRTEHGNYAF